MRGVTRAWSSSAWPWLGQAFRQCVSHQTALAWQGDVHSYQRTTAMPERFEPTQSQHRGDKHATTGLNECRINVCFPARGLSTIAL